MLQIPPNCREVLRTGTYTSFPEIRKAESKKFRNGEHRGVADDKDVSAILGSLVRLSEMGFPTKSRQCVAGVRNSPSGAS
jgi:hypothetical protein